MAKNLGCDGVLISAQRFIRLVDTILDITSFDKFSLDVPKQLERISDYPLFSFGGGSTIINLKSSNVFFSYIQNFASFYEDYAWLNIW